MCLVHLLGELKIVMYKDSSGDWAAFSKKLKRLVQDAVRLWKRREEFDKVIYASRRKRIELRLKIKESSYFFKCLLKSSLTIRSTWTSRKP